MTKHLVQDKLWAGTEESLHAHMQQMEAGEMRMAGGNPYEDDEDEDKLPHLLSVNEGVGIISVKGPLTNRNDWWLPRAGITSYSAIREALVYAANDQSISKILLDIDSGGGAVNGVSDVSTLIQNIDRGVKPVTAFTDGMMASAAYWIGASARSVYASKVATVGSIGVLSTHMEYSKQLKDDGVGVTVMRAGKYKALVNSVEPLTSDAKEEMQAKLDAAYQVFVQHVADSRSVSYDVADKQMGQGREFFGQQAVGAGLIDGVESFDSLFSRLSADTIDKTDTYDNNRSKIFSQPGMSGSSEVNMAGRKALTEQQIAALAESAPVTGEAQAAPAEDPAEVIEPAAETAQEHAQEPAQEASAGVDTQLVSYLQSQVKERDEAAVKAQVQIATMTEKLASAEAVVGDLVAIAAKSLNNMQVALGGAAIDMSTATPLTVITEHKRVSAQFMNTFKAGSVAAVDAASPDKGETAVTDSLTQARLAATRFK